MQTKACKLGYLVEGQIKVQELRGIYMNKKEKCATCECYECDCEECNCECHEEVVAEKGND